MTDPTGCSFLSYRRSRSAEARLLIAAQHDHGVPTWRDTHQLNEGPTEDEIRRVLRDPSTASGVLWITPEVKGSAIIRQVEAPLLLERVRQGDGFFVVPVAAGGLDYSDAAALLQGAVTLEDLRGWNLRRVREDPIGMAEADAIASRIVERRLKVIDGRLATDVWLSVAVYTRVAAASSLGDALAFDWSSHFNGREAPAEAWRDRILPSLTRSVNALRTYASGRTVHLHGYCSLPAALAVGRAFLEPGGIPVAWRQKMMGGSEQLWSLGEMREDCGFRIELQAGSAESEHLAVMLSVTEDVRRAVASSADLPSFRAVLHARKDGDLPHVISSPGQAVDLARIVAAAMRKARSEYPEVRVGHLFVAAPAGLAVLLGQLTNTFGAIQTYEHIETDLVGTYRPAALLGDAG